MGIYTDKYSRFLAEVRTKRCYGATWSKCCTDLQCADDFCADLLCANLFSANLLCAALLCALIVFALIHLLIFVYSRHDFLA